ncbi:MAG: tail fiber protein [Anaerolineales bacterium]|jgi:microcystin-dependent protein|nr:tail fiber protein [Anaerolineales bacterium]
MGLETVTHIDDLVIANPVATDDKSQGDDHLRNIKKAIKATFANVTGAISATHTELDYTNVAAVGTSEASKALVTDANGSIDVAAHDGSSQGLKLGGTLITSTAAELNHSDGVTSNIQTQIDGVSSPTASVIAYAGSSAPSGWLLCDGASISRSTYSTLYAAIGTTYGSASESTFNVPDIEGRVIAGKESSDTRLTSGGSGINGGTLGSTGGTETHTLLTAEMPAHTHTQDDDAFTGTSASGSGGGWHTSVGSQATGATGGDGAHQNTQPTIVLNYIIKT